MLSACFAEQHKAAGAALINDMYMLKGKGRMDGAKLWPIEPENRLTAALSHCKHTYEDLLFIQVCSDPTAMQ